MNTVVGVIGRAHGVRGEVAVELRTDEPERRFATGQVLLEEGGTRQFTVRSARNHSGRLLVSFAELVDRAGDIDHPGHAVGGETGLVQTN